MKIFLNSQRLYNFCQHFHKNNTGFGNYHLLNLKQTSPLFIHNVYRSMAIRNLQVPKTDVNKFLYKLTNAYISEESTCFQEVLNFASVKNLLDERLQIVENMENLAKLMEEDEELKKLGKEETLVYENRLIQVDNELIDLIVEYLGGDQYSDIILEISAGVGGQESMLFVKDLFEMYLKHMSYLGYTSEIIQLDDSSIGGIRNVSMMISGKDCYTKLIHEAGIHRVQRVPTTEKSGRVHTSVVSVVVLPQPNDIQITINPNDLKIDTMRATGAGGQHVNTTDSAVRITHLPSGVMTECQIYRSQIKNRKLALIKLRTKLYDLQFNKEQKSIISMRKEQMGKRERNEKIRTYNFTQDRITDHRLSDGSLHNLKNFLLGGKALDELHQRLDELSKYKLLVELIAKV